MDIRTKEIYSEVNSVLNTLGEKYILKLPKNLYEMICEEKLNNYNPKYEPNIPLENQKIKRDSIAMIALFHLNYWCDTQEEKDELERLYTKNEDIHREKMKTVYSSDNIFKNDTTNVVKNNQPVNNQQIVEYKKESIFGKILNKIKKLFRIK
jgi:hypothetical protein